MECVEGRHTIESVDDLKEGNEKKITHLRFRRPPTDNGPHSNQLKRWAWGRQYRRGGSTGGDCVVDVIPYFRGE